jgi:parafibromin
LTSIRRETQISTTYYVVDSVEELSKFGTDAWDRVVCVMTTGQAWQFRPYKWNEPRALFHHGVLCLNFQLWLLLLVLLLIICCFTVKGVYVQWANDPPNTKISDWNVTPLKVSCSDGLLSH